MPTDTLTAIAAALPIAAGFCFGITALACAVGFAIEKSAWGLGRQIYAVPLAKGQLRWELHATLRFCALASVAFAVVLGADLLGTTEETWRSGLYSFLVLWLGFDAYYYVLHRALHHRSLMRFHRWHHKSRVTSPLTGFSMGWFESLAWVLAWVVIAIVASMVHPVSLRGLTAYAVVIFVANILGHTNAEWFPRFAGTKKMSWVNHPITFHSLHHARYEKHFGFAFTFFDRGFGTEWADWPSLFARVVSGQPMKRLQERGEAE